MWSTTVRPAELGPAELGPAELGPAGTCRVALKVPNAASKRVVRDQDFDVAELAIVTFLMAKARGVPLALGRSMPDPGPKPVMPFTDENVCS